MKPVRFIIPKTGTNSFRVQIDEQAHFYDSVHFHPEHQITHILKGEGTCLIGNHVERFKPGDVFMVGKNVPHVFKSDQTYYHPGNKLESKYISLFFKDETFGRQFFEIPELAHIKRLLDMASMGVKITDDDRDKVSQMINKTEHQEGFERFQSLLSILDKLATASTLQALSSMRYDAPSKDLDNERINVVFNYMSNNFKLEITLEEISSIANMTPNAFCRYFKQRTGKTFSNFLNEVRIEYAGKLIAGSNEPFGNISIESGYNSISYFNRKFKQITGLSPLMYRKRYSTILEA